MGRSTLSLVGTAPARSLIRSDPRTGSPVGNDAQMRPRRRFQHRREISEVNRRHALPNSRAVQRNPQWVTQDAEVGELQVDLGRCLRFGKDIFDPGILRCSIAGPGSIVVVVLALRCICRIGTGSDRCDCDGKSRLTEGGSEGRRSARQVRGQACIRHDG